MANRLLVYKCRACGHTFSEQAPCGDYLNPGHQLMQAADVEFITYSHKCGAGTQGGVEFGLGDLIGIRNHVE